MIDIGTLVLHFMIGGFLLWISVVQLSKIKEGVATMVVRFSLTLYWVLEFYHLKELSHADVDLLLSKLFILIPLILLSLSANSIQKLIKYAKKDKQTGSSLLG